MLVDAGEEIGVVPLETMVTHEHVGEDLLVGVADVRSRVGVVNRGGDVKRLAQGMCSWLKLLCRERDVYPLGPEA